MSHTPASALGSGVTVTVSAPGYHMTLRQPGPRADSGLPRWEFPPGL